MRLEIWFHPTLGIIFVKHLAAIIQSSKNSDWSKISITYQFTTYGLFSYRQRKGTILFIFLFLLRDSTRWHVNFTMDSTQNYTNVTAATLGLIPVILKRIFSQLDGIIQVCTFRAFFIFFPPRLFVIKEIK